MIQEPERISLAGENSLIIYFSEQPDKYTSARIAIVKTILYKTLGSFIVDMIPSYVSLFISWDPLTVDYRIFKKKVSKCLKGIPHEQSELAGNLIELPVYYSPPTGPDLESLAAKKQLSIEKLIKIHHNCEYRVFAIGFAPGFAYLGEVDERISGPRRSSPRLHVPAGSVGIAGRQTAIYPSSSPGGWNIIGRCPVQLFSPIKDDGVKFCIADRVRFFSIDREEYLAFGGNP